VPSSDLEALGLGVGVAEPDVGLGAEEQGWHNTHQWEAEQSHAASDEHLDGSNTEADGEAQGEAAGDSDKAESHNTESE